MSYNTWHDYGFGICVDDIKTTEDKVFELIHLAPSFEKEFYKWIETFREDVDPESIAELITMDQINEYEDSSCCLRGLGVIIKQVINECEDINLLICDDFDCYHYLIFSMHYPWYMSEKEKNMTEKDVYDLFNKYVSMLTDEFISIDYQEVENGG
jgi:hypothetical protein